METSQNNYLCFLRPVKDFVLMITLKKAAGSIVVLGAALLMASCGGGESVQKPMKKAEGQIKDSKGRTVDIYYGRVFKVNEVEDFSTFFPHAVTDVVSHRISNQVYQGLMRLDQTDLSVIPCIARKFDVNEDATVFTYYLRSGVYFQDDECFSGGKGREVTAHDFKYCFDLLCTSTRDASNPLYGLVKDRLLGAEEHYLATRAGEKPEGGVKGVKVLNDTTLQITLKRPFAAFNMIMTTPAGWVFPKEVYEKYGADMRTRMVGTGAFMQKKVESDVVILERNPNYWEKDEFGNQLPYLDGIKVTFKKEKNQELMEFKKGDFDLVFQLPVKEIKNVLVDFNELKEGANKEWQTQITNALTIQYYAFLHDHPVFKDVRVRKAFNLAINRKKLVDFTLQGEGDPALYGFVPPVNGYPYEDIQGFPEQENVDEARKLLADAGYPNGRGFPEVTLQLNSGGSTNELLAEAVQNQLKENLGVTVTFDVQTSMNQHMLKFETGQSEFWRAAWVADYPDPQNFLNLFYGEHIPEKLSDRAYINPFRYRSAEFDSLYALALRTVDNTERMRILAQADQVLINDAAVMPLYYDSYIRLLQNDVVNFPMNPMEYRDFSRVFFRKESEEKKDSKAGK
jgi:peptide/nickel transport system substrate-binding protein